MCRCVCTCCGECAIVVQVCVYRYAVMSGQVWCVCTCAGGSVQVCSVFMCSVYLYVCVGVQVCVRSVYQ